MNIQMTGLDDIEFPAPEACPECGIGDAEYGLHRSGCPSGFATMTVEEDQNRREYLALDEPQDTADFAEEEQNR